MSKKLDSILNTMPPATVGSSVVRMPVQEQQVKQKVGGEGDRSEKKEQGMVRGTEPVLQTVKNEQSKIAPSINQIDEKVDRIVAMIPYSLKREIKQYLVDHPGDTEKTVLLRGLKAFGFTVPEEYLEDFRGKKSVK